MKKRTERQTDHRIAVDINGLSAMLSCGRDTARKIGEDAGARINVGRRVLYSVDKIERHIDRISI